MYPCPTTLISSSFGNQWNAVKVFFCNISLFLLKVENVSCLLRFYLCIITFFGLVMKQTTNQNLAKPFTSRQNLQIYQPKIDLKHPKLVKTIRNHPQSVKTNYNYLIPVKTTENHPKLTTTSQNQLKPFKTNYFNSHSKLKDFSLIIKNF